MPGKKKETREEEVRFRVTPEEMKAMQQAAFKVGLTAGPWARMVALKALMETGQ